MQITEPLILYGIGFFCTITSFAVHKTLSNVLHKSSSSVLGLGVKGSAVAPWTM